MFGAASSSAAVGAPVGTGATCAGAGVASSVAAARGAVGAGVVGAGAGIVRSAMASGERPIHRRPPAEESLRASWPDASHALARIRTDRIGRLTNGSSNRIEPQTLDFQDTGPTTRLAALADAQAEAVQLPMPFAEPLPHMTVVAHCSGPLSFSASASRPRLPLHRRASGRV